MQPTLEQVINTIEYSLRHDLIPELQCSWAKQTGARMLWVLDHLRQRALHEHAFAVEENAELRALMALANEERSGDSELAAALRSVDLEGLPLEEPAWPELEILLGENNRLRSSLDAIVEASPESDVANAALPLWREILAYFERQAERELRLAGKWPGPSILPPARTSES